MFHEEIDKMQSDINQLLDLCAETNQPAGTDNQELGELILMAQDDDLDEKGYKLLEKRLTEDNESLEYYVDFQWLTVMLAEEYGNRLVLKMVDTISAHADA